MKYRIAFVIVFLAASFAFSGVKNVDKPANGEWNLQLKKEWEILIKLLLIV